MSEYTTAPAQKTAPYILPIIVCFFINMLDGFDILAIAFTGPSIAKEWSLDFKILGVVFSSALLGMTLGSFFISPFADRIGRRKIILICLVIMTIGMALSGFTETVSQLILIRFVTGLGIGGILATLNTTVAEIAPAKRRNMAISFLSIGYPIGSVLGGMLSAYLIATTGWRSVFLIGSVLSTIMIILAYFFLPETANLKKSHDPSQKNIISQTGHSILSLFKQDIKYSTFLICAAYFSIMFCFYFILNWTPKIAVDMGFSITDGVTTTIILSASGILGGIAFGFLADKIGLFNVAIIFIIMLGLSVIIFGHIPASKNLLFGTAFLIGFLMAGAMTSLYSIVAQIYPISSRASGTGFAIGIGRLGATLGPLTAGFLIAHGWERAEYYLFFSLSIFLAAFIIMKIRSHVNKT